jgi:hypothetical protein
VSFYVKCSGLGVGGWGFVLKGSYIGTLKKNKKYFFEKIKKIFLKKK